MRALSSLVRSPVAPLEMLKQRLRSKTKVLTLPKNQGIYSIIKASRKLRNKIHTTKMQIKMVLKVGKMAHG